MNGLKPICQWAIDLWTFLTADGQYPIMENTFVQRLEMTMEQQGLDMKALSLRAGYNETYVRDVLRRGKIPSITALMKLSAALGISSAWLLLGDNIQIEGSYPITQVPLVSFVNAGGLKRVEGVRPADIEKYIPATNLPNGDWIALTVEGDSMNRIAPEGSTILVNRAEDTLLDGQFYVFALETGEATFKRFRRQSRSMLQPYSLNPDHLPIPVDEDEIYVVGRVRRAIIDM